MNTTPESYPIEAVAELSGVTVRALHHYDEIGLLSPRARTPAGYRRYDDADLERLQQILFYRALGFPLEKIVALLDDPPSAPWSICDASGRCSPNTGTGWAP